MDARGALQVAFVLHPNAHRNRSMQLYAQRLVDAAPADQRWRTVALPGVRGRLAQWASELLVPPVALATLRADVVHIVDHAHAGYLNFWRGPSVVTVHDLIPLKSRAGVYPVPHVGGLATRTWFRYNMSALEKATRLVTPSQASADDLQALLGLGAVVVPNGIETCFFDAPPDTATAEVARRLPATPARVMLQVSTGFFYKNDGAFVEVFCRVARQHPGLHAVRVGSPLPEPHRKRLRSLGLSERFIDCGKVDIDTLRALYRRADLLLFPSWDEGFGWPPLEAMAGGCPVVASDAGALRETVGPCGLTAPPTDLDGLTRHVLRVLSESPGPRATRVAAGRDFARSFSWRRAADALAEIYRQIAR